ncbi:phosphotransferase [Nocardioides sp. C4-1]|uniref:phosphotransferase family protein n=1 Tax=Nocardioides sp. C4-1 TaxID=3151851 RepID=UPI0032637268
MDFASMEPLPGGWSGETFVASVAGERQVVRVHARRPERAEVDAALLRLVRGLVPVPEVLEVRAPSGDLPALLVTSYLPGVRGDLLLPDLDDARLARLGRHVGELVATLGGMPVLRPGELVGPGLRIEPFDLPDGLPGYVEAHLARLEHWAVAERDGLVDLAREAQALLDTVDRTCLVHSDLNPKNLLVDPETLAVTGLVDWEFAHAGHPFTDLGNVLRFERQPAYVEGVLSAYAERRGTPPDEALALARAADLWALVDLAARRDENPVAKRAHDLLRERVTARFDTVGAPA